MAQGFSGGFFLPAQRSVHCKGGFFASAQHQPRRAPGASSSAQFPVLFSLSNPATTSSLHATNVRSRPRVYDPAEGDEEGDREALEALEDEMPASQSREPPQRVVRPQPPPGAARPSDTRRKPVNKVLADGQETRKKTPMATAAATRSGGGRDPAPPGDINVKFKMAMDELNDIKGEYELKQQRQQSAPVLPTTSAINRERINPAFDDPQRGDRTVPLGEPAQSPSSAASGSNKNAPGKDEPASPPALANSTAPQATTTAANEATTINEQSPRKRLQVAEMVMRKLYKNNLHTEKLLADTRAENERLQRRLAELETTREATPSHPSSHTPQPSMSAPPTATTLTTVSTASTVPPPSRQSLTRIDQEQLEYLRHLAAEQDRTITSLKIRIEELSGQLTQARREATKSSSTGGGGSGKKTPRQVVNKLQSKLQDALVESERQKHNYLQMKRDFQNLLALKTKSLYENPALLQSSARELVQLMERQMKKLEHEHTQHLTAYNSKLYEVEQQTCESYAQQKLVEEELARVARDVQQRDALDVEIEQCMVQVFERLHQVESENVNLKTRLSGS